MRVLVDTSAWVEHFRMLSRATVATQEEVESLIEDHAISGRGIDWVDAHLIASCLLDGCELLTHDQKLKKAGSLILGVR